MAGQQELDAELDAVFTEVDQEFDQVIQLLKDKPNPTPQDTAATIARLEAFRGGVKDKLRDALAAPPPADAGGTPPA